MKKKYTVNVHYDVVLTTEVFAENEEQALDLAVDNTDQMSLNEGECVDNNPCVTDVEFCFDEPLTPQKETLINRIKSVLEVNGYSYVPLNFTKDEIFFSSLNVDYINDEKEIANIDISYIIDSSVGKCQIENTPMECLTEVLSKVQSYVHNSK